MGQDQLPDPDFIINNYQEAKDVKWLCYGVWNEGPCDGMVEWNKQRYYAFWFDGNEYSICGESLWIRKYVLLKLTDEQQESVDFWNELNEICYEKYKTEDILLQNKEAMEKFYQIRIKMDYKELDLSESDLVGWFKN